MGLEEPCKVAKCNSVDGRLSVIGLICYCIGICIGLVLFSCENVTGVCVRKHRSLTYTVDGVFWCNGIKGESTGTESLSADRICRICRNSRKNSNKMVLCL